MRNQSVWPGKVAALLKSGNPDGALAQIKVAPSVKDLQALQKILATAGAGSSTVLSAIKDQIAALSSPRLHRSP